MGAKTVRNNRGMIQVVMIVDKKHSRQYRRLSSGLPEKIDSLSCLDCIP